MAIVTKKGDLKGYGTVWYHPKTTRKMPEKVIINSCDKLPDSLLEEHGNVTLTVDIMYFNGIHS